MTKLTTHVLDVYSGKPGSGIKVELYYLKNNEREKKKFNYFESRRKSRQAIIGRN